MSWKLFEPPKEKYIGINVSDTNVTICMILAKELKAMGVKTVRIAFDKKKKVIRFQFDESEGVFPLQWCAVSAKLSSEMPRGRYNLLKKRGRTFWFKKIED